MPCPRRKLAVAFAAAAVALIALSIVSAADAGYHLADGKVMLPQRHQGHVYLHALGDPPGLAILVALAMLGAAGYFGIVRRGVRIAATAIVGVVATLTALAYCGTTLLQEMSGESGGSTVATSQRYEVIRYERRGLLSSDDIVLRLRSREGLMSYESDADLACFIEDSSGAGPEWLFDHVSLAAGDTVQIVAKDSTVWQVQFDPRTLRPTNPVDRCTGAPDPMAAS